jgi:dCMP deaminase
MTIHRIELLHYYSDLVTLVGKRSTCIRRAAGAVALDPRSRIIGVGYNGVPSGWPHCIDMPCEGAEDESGDTTRCVAVHAEQNLLLNCGDPKEITTILLSATPCKPCALLLSNLPNLDLIYYVERYPDEAGWDIIRQKGVSLRELPHPASWITP